MAQLSRTNLSRSWTFFTVYLASLSCATAAVNLDVLTACEDIAALHSSLKEQESFSGTCRAPRSVIEKALIARAMPPGSPSDLVCIQRTAAAPFLSSFTCIRSKVKTGASLTCFRPAEISDIHAYKAQFSKKTAEPIADYLKKAARCSASNGNASHAADSTMPGLLKLISRFEFGYITSLGKGDTPDSSILHGYAASDPALPSGAPTALEFVYLGVGAPPYIEPGELKRVGDWSVRVGGNAALDDEYNQEARRRRFLVAMKSESYQLERHDGPPYDDNAKRRLLEELQKKIANTIEEEGFTAVSDRQLSAKSGKTREQMLQEFTKKMPFGTRTSTAVRLAPTFHILMNEQHPVCTGGGEGAMAAMLFSILPVAEVESDYGDIQLIVFGMGECGKRSSAVRGYLGGLIEEATSELFATLRRK